MTLIALIEQKTELKLWCGVGTFNEVQNIFFNSPSIKKRKLNAMVCRHFCHVPPRAVISSVLASPSSWSSGELQRFSARCEETMPATGIRDALPSPGWCPTKPSWQSQALLTRQIFQEEHSACLWDSLLLASHAKSCLLFWPAAWPGLCSHFVTQVPQVSRSSNVPLLACASCKAISWSQAGELESSVAWECLGRMQLGWDSCISSLNLVP